jgi:hypothetical protein
MKWLCRIIFFFILPLSYSAKAKNFTDTKSFNTADTLTWIDHFKILRTAIYQHNTAAVKRYFRFPVLNPNNEIWYLVLSESQVSKKKITGNRLVPFNEKDMVQHFNKIFPAAFIKGILKVKTDVLYKKGYFETEEQADDSATKYRMYVTYEKKSGLLFFNLACKTKIKDGEGSITDYAESNVIYYFQVLKNSRLVFKEIRLAG